MQLTPERIAEIEKRFVSEEEFKVQQDRDFGYTFRMAGLAMRDLPDAIADLKEARERIRELEAACAALKENLYLLWEDINNPEREEAGISDDVRFSIDLMLRMATKGKAGQAVLERMKRLEAVAEAAADFVELSEGDGGNVLAYDEMKNALTALEGSESND